MDQNTDTVVNTKVKPRRDINKSIIFGIIALLVLAVGIAAGLLLVRQPQEIREKASTPTGTAKVFLTPETKTINAGETFTATVLFDTAGIAISGLTVKLDYPFTGETPPISAISVDINSSLVLDSEWDFPIKNITSSGGKVTIEIAGLSTSVDGYTTNGQENLATITFRGNSAGTINVSFDPLESVIANKADEQDVLLIPQSTGTYVVTGSGATPTPTSGSSPTPTPAGSSSTTTPTPTAPPVPVTGISKPTLIGIIVSIFFISGSILLAL